MVKKILTWSLIVSLSLGFLTHQALADSVDESAARAANYLLAKRDAAGSIGGIGFSAWALQALAAANKQSPETINYLETNLGSIETAPATDLERTILAVLAAGKNPRDFGNKNLVAILKTKAESNQIGSTSQVNDDIFGILALLASGESVIEPVISGSIQFLLSTIRTDGSYSWSTLGGGDSNNTAAAIQALELAKDKGYNGETKISLAKTYLQSSQNADGGFGYQPGQTSDGSSTSWAIHAIVALGERPEDWNKDSNTPFTFLQSLQTADGGVKWQTDSEPDLFTTSFAAIAFARMALPVATISYDPSPSPLPSPSPTLVPSPSPTPTPSPSPTPTPSLAPSPTPAVSSMPSATPISSPSLSPTPTFGVSPSASPTLIPLPDETPTSVVSPLPNASISPSPTVSLTTSPTNRSRYKPRTLKPRKFKPRVPVFRFVVSQPTSVAEKPPVISQSTPPPSPPLTTPSPAVFAITIPATSSSPSNTPTNQVSPSEQSFSVPPNKVEKRVGDSESRMTDGTTEKIVQTSNDNNLTSTLTVSPSPAGLITNTEPLPAVKGATIDKDPTLRLIIATAMVFAGLVLFCWGLLIPLTGLTALNTKPRF